VDSTFEGAALIRQRPPGASRPTSEPANRSLVRRKVSARTLCYQLRTDFGTDRRERRVCFELM
jgi:hypothetical protein